MLTPAPISLLDGTTPVPFGVYDGLIHETSTNAIDQGGGLFSRRRTQRKSWIFTGVYTSEVIGVMAIVDAGYFTNAFTYFYHFGDKTFCSDSTLIPLGLSHDFEAGIQSVWKIGKYSIEPKENTLYISYNDKFKLLLELQIQPNGIRLVAPSSPSRPFNFAFKNVCLPVKFQLQFGQKSYTAEGNFGAIDYTKSYPPRKTFWNWCSFVGMTASGKKIGLNLVEGFNSELENVLWVDGQRIFLGEAYFLLQKPYKKKPWQIGSKNKLIEFTLHPSGAREENTNLLFLKSQFTQAFGKMEGTFTFQNQTESFIAYGVTENHLALW